LTDRVEARLLAALRRAPTRSGRLEELAAAASSSPQEAEAAATRLRKAGFPLALSEAGVVSLGWDTPLHEGELRGSIRTRLIGRTLRVHGSVSSTQDVARKAFRVGGDPGLVLVAEHQRSGRGRLGRLWEAPAGKNLLFSVVVSPPETAPAAGLTITSAVAVAEAIDKRLHLDARIRWPNDVLVREKKVAGILVESVTRQPGERSFIVGVGLNVNAVPSGLPAAGCLSEAAGRGLDRTLLLLAVLEELDHWYEVLLRGHAEQVEARWRARSSILGRRVTLQREGQLYQGRVVDLSVGEGIILELGPGMTRVFPAEHVTLKADS